jgi:imidazole glycerol-phosphate synthase subunit HisH
VITVVDYGMGNLRNVRRAFLEIGHEVLVTAEPAMISQAERIVLPGVGAFGEAARRIDNLGLRGPLTDHVMAGRPLLGICLGMQLLFDRSEESPFAAGLGFLSGDVMRFGPGVKVPHIGWNDVAATGDSSVIAAEEQKTCYYFVHSYYIPVIGETVATTDYGIRFSSAIQKGNVAGVQFHPEKSQTAGLTLLKRWTSYRL